MPHFIDRNWDSALDLGREARALARLVRLGALRSMATRVGQFFDDPRLCQVFSFQAMYAGLSPFEALAVFCIITYMDCVQGVVFAEGGIHAIRAVSSMPRAGAVESTSSSGARSCASNGRPTAPSRPSSRSTGPGCLRTRS